MDDPKVSGAAMYGVEEAYARILKKHEKHLKETNDALIKKAKDVFKTEIKQFRTELQSLRWKVEKIERYINIKTAIEGKESK